MNSAFYYITDCIIIIIIICVGFVGYRRYRAVRLFKGIWKSVEITFSKWLIVGNYHETVKFIVGVLPLLRNITLTDVMNSM